MKNKNAMLAKEYEELKKEKARVEQERIRKLQQRPVGSESSGEGPSRRQMDMIFKMQEIE